MEDFFSRYPQLEICRKDIEMALQLMTDTYDKGGKVLVCGNGGSAADCEHIVGELMKGFIEKRSAKDKRLSSDLRRNLQEALPAISLCSQTGLTTAFNNDLNPDFVFAQQVYGYGMENDLLIAISTSGNSENILNAVKTANCLGIRTIAMTGESGGKLKMISTVTICAPATETYKIQEYHLPIYHYLCAMTEKYFFNKKRP